MRTLSFGAALAAFLALPLANAEEIAPPQRFAFLVANLSYSKAVGELHNTKNDVDRVAGALLKIGFPQENIVKEVDLTADKLREELRKYVERVKIAGEGAISFFYYSGHGAAAPKNTPGAMGTNYIIPYNLDSVTREDFWRQAVPLDEVSHILSDAYQARHFVIFDACRNELRLPSRGSKGFEAVAVSQEVEMLLAFATAPGGVALDGMENEVNGPYAAILSDEIQKPNIDHMHLFSNVRARVRIKTHIQIPWISDALQAPVVLNPTAVPRSDPKIAEKCDVPTITVPEVPMVWTPVPDKSWVRFKTHTYTYQLARTNAKRIEEVEEGVAHHVADGARIYEGKQDGVIVWYRYNRDAGFSLPRYVVAEEAELR
jgi:hypothetical protein